MLLKSFNSTTGFSVGQLYPIDIADSNGNIIANNITVSAKANLGSIGNLIITGGSAGQAIVTDGAGNLSFTVISDLSNGYSNIQILNNSNISFSSAGNANIMIVTGTGVNVAGTLNATGNANVGNLQTTGAVIASTLTSNVATGTAPVTVSSTTLVANLNADLLDGYDTATANTANTVAVRDANGSISASFFIGNGSQLTGISATSLVNGTSNVVTTSNGNVTIGIAGNAAIATFTGTGANVTGTLNATGNVTAQGTGSNIIRRAFGLFQTANAGQTSSAYAAQLDDIYASVSSSNQLVISATALPPATSPILTGWTQTMTAGTITIQNWINISISPNFSGLSGAMNSQGHGCIAILTDQAPTATSYRITVVRSGTSGAMWNISIERLV